jgi:hypothetical protein
MLRSLRASRGMSAGECTRSEVEGVPEELEVARLGLVESKPAISIPTVSMCTLRRRCSTQSNLPPKQHAPRS